MSSDFTHLEERVRRLAKGMTAMTRDLTRAGLVEQPSSVSPLPIRRLMDALDAFPGLVGYLNGRRSGGGIASVNSEADVQDLLYLSLKPLFPEMVYEEPTQKGAAAYSIGDFSIPSLKLVLEAKYVAKQADVKAKGNEIAEDIWKYTTQTDCERIIFFVYDPYLLIPDRPNYVRSLSTAPGDFKSKGREVEIRTVIKP